jgi:hypothetical protein
MSFRVDSLFTEAVDAVKLQAYFFSIFNSVPDDDDRDGPRNVGSMQTPDKADSLRRLNRI